MLQSLFAVPILVTELGLKEPVRHALRERALTAYHVNNLNAKPWSRVTRESLAVQAPEFQSLFASVARVAEMSFGIQVASITGRELVQFDGDFVPPHVESSALSPFTGLMRQLRLTTQREITTGRWCFKALLAHSEPRCFLWRSGFDLLIQSQIAC